MAISRTALSLPRHWEDWVNLVLGIWLCTSPWVLPGSDEGMTAIQNTFLTGFLLIVIETVALTAFRIWEEWISVAIGAWLIASPWVLGITAAVAVANLSIVGVVVLALALYEMWEEGSHSAHPA
jgi:hypothetical protein